MRRNRGRRRGKEITYTHTYNPHILNNRIIEQHIERESKCEDQKNSQKHQLEKNVKYINKHHHINPSDW